MFECTTDKYDVLYRRWLKNPGDLLDRAGFEPGMRVIDLCGGTGVVAFEALRRGAAEVVLVDLNPRAPVTERLHQVKGDAHNVMDLMWPHWGTRSFDLVVCRQAIAYLEDLPKLAREVSTMLRPGGKFVFNTFRRPRWGARTYKLDGRRYFEASGHIGRIVGHVQAAWGVGLDVSIFEWRPTNEIVDKLPHAFSQSQVTETERSIYITCVV